MGPRAVSLLYRHGWCRLEGKTLLVQHGQREVQLLQRVLNRLHEGVRAAHVRRACHQIRHLPTPGCPLQHHTDPGLHSPLLQLYLGVFRDKAYTTRPQLRRLMGCCMKISACRHSLTLFRQQAAPAMGSCLRQQAQSPQHQHRAHPLPDVGRIDAALVAGPGVVPAGDRDVHLYPAARGLRRARELLQERRLGRGAHGVQQRDSVPPLGQLPQHRAHRRDACAGRHTLLCQGTGSAALCRLILPHDSTPASLLNRFWREMHAHWRQPYLAC